MHSKTLADRIARFREVDLYPVVSSEFTLGRAVPEVIEAIARGGAKVVQLREKHRADRELFDLARVCREITARYGMLLIIDDRPDIALACGADGVHVGQDDLPVAAVRKLAPNLLVGCSTHNPEEAASALRDDTGYFNIGPIYPTQTKSVSCGAVGLDMIGRIAPMAGDVPFSVMGGIKARHIPELRRAGARHIAMVTEITAAPDIEAKVRELRELFR